MVLISMKVVQVGRAMPRQTRSSRLNRRVICDRGRMMSARDATPGRGGNLGAALPPACESFPFTVVNRQVVTGGKVAVAMRLHHGAHPNESQTRARLLFVRSHGSPLSVTRLAGLRVILRHVLPIMPADLFFCQFLAPVSAQLVLARMTS